MSTNKSEKAHLIIDVRKSGNMELRLCWFNDGLKRRRLGVLKMSPTPILDTVLSSVDRLTVDELIRLRNAPKVWDAVSNRIDRWNRSSV